MTVAMAAPAGPIAGSPHQPKMKNGSRMILVTAPMIWVHIEYFVRPVDCRKRSAQTCR